MIVGEPPDPVSPFASITLTVCIVVPDTAAACAEAEALDEELSLLEES